MKKLFTILAVCVAMVSANAQTAVKGNKFADNWTLGISGGVITPTVNHAFFGSMRPTITLEATKWFTPVYALAVQGQTGINYDKLGSMFPESNFGKSKTAFDAAQVMLLNKFNLSNLFGGYKGEPRFFELEAYFGAGYTHFYLNGADNNGLDGFSSKTGLNFNFNLGESKAWQINIKPAITWVLDADNSVHPMNYNVNHSAVELTAGVTYKFATSNGTHNFAFVKEYDQAEVDGLNSKINSLRGQVDGLNNEVNNLKAQNAKLQSDLNDCKNRKPEVVKNVVNRDLESYITFAQGKSVVERSQMPNVERVATYMKNHKDANVVIKGYASPEGSAEINAKLSKNRAEAVKDVLVKKYGIKASRIQAEGQGVGNMFKEPDWNRVSICTLDK